MKNCAFLVLIVSLIYAPAYSASIRVTSPQGGEEWRLKQVRYISWESEGVTADLRITLWRDGILAGVIANEVSPESVIQRWPVGQSKRGWASPGKGYQVKVKQKGTSVFGMSSRPFEILPEKDVTDLSLSDCVLKDRSGKIITQWPKGESARLSFRVRVPAEKPCFKFEVEAWSVHGQPSPAGFALRGKTVGKNLFIFTPPWTEKTGAFYLECREEKSGNYTLMVRARAVVPEGETDTRNNLCRIPFKVLLERKSQNEAGVAGKEVRRLTFRPNLTISFHNMAPNRDSFNVWIRNVQHRIAPVRRDVQVYARFDVYRGTPAGWVNFETHTLSGISLDSLNSEKGIYVGFFSRKWVDAGATTCTVIVDSREEVVESDETDNQCVIRF